jgi:hypothetical protein
MNDIETLSAERDALAEQNARLRAALEKACPESPMAHDDQGGCVWCDQGDVRHGTSDKPHKHYYDCGWRIGREALALTPPAALEELRRRERIATLLDVAFDLGRVHGEWRAASIVAEMAEHLEQQLADAIRDAREKGGGK